MKSTLVTGSRPWLQARSKIAEITALSNSLGAIDLAQGFPDDQPPAQILECFEAAAGERHGHQYSDPRGAALLRRNIAAKLEDFNSIAADAEREIVVTCGASEGLMATFRALFDEGDRVMTFSPLYENYLHQANAAGLEIHAIPLTEPNFSISIEALEAAYSDRVRAILVCNPCNPTGKVFSEYELSLLVDFAIRYNLILVADETYERFIWRGRHCSVASLPGAKDRTVTIFSMGKTYSVTGWRIGYVVAPESLLGPITRVRELSTICAPHICQLALARALKLPEAFYAAEKARYGQRKSLLTAAVIESGLKPWDPQGGYFLWCNYAHLSDDDDTVFAERMIREVGLAGVPGQVFFPRKAPPSKRIRFTFSKSLATISDASHRLANLRLGSHIPVGAGA